MVVTRLATLSRSGSTAGWLVGSWRLRGMGVRFLLRSGLMASIPAGGMNASGTGSRDGRTSRSPTETLAALAALPSRLACRDAAAAKDHVLPPVTLSALRRDEAEDQLGDALAPTARAMLHTT